MIVKRFYAPGAEVATLGLKEINMPRLGRYVALAGKNGSGKSRILNRLIAEIAARPHRLSNAHGHRQTIQRLQQAIRTNPSDPAVPEWRRSIDQYQNIISDTLGRVVADEGAHFRALPFVPKYLNLEDPRSQNIATINNRYSQTKGVAVEGIHSHCLFYIQKLQDRWWSASHPRYMGELSEKDEAERQYESFVSLIKVLLGTELTRSANDYAELFGRPLAEANLSDGQKVILQLAVALHAQHGSLDSTIFILDEPENHLHPSASIELLQRLDMAAPNAQIWIATHSVPLLAYVANIEPMALWYVEDGRVSNAGRHPERVLGSLLGDEERVGQLHAFTGLPAVLAATNYAAESLRPPTVIGGQGKDDQQNQIAKILGERFPRYPVSILDFGAGKGRLLEGLASDIGDKRASDIVDYIAYDEATKDSDICCSVISHHFGSSAGRYFNSRDEFFSTKDDHSIDVVVMCNVLHEVPPAKWGTLFTEDSLLGRSLMPNGYLLLVEDQRIPIGEKAHEQGFIVMNTAHLKTIFAVTEADIAAGQFVVDDHRGDGRLKAHLIGKSLLARMTTDTRTRAIRQLQATAVEQIRQLRAACASYANGQLHGFWTQQLANAYLYLQENP